jgi:hypothetical protein
VTQEEVLKGLSADSLAKLRSDVAFQVSGRSFEGFLDNVKIVEPPQFASGFQGGPVDFQKWEHLIDLAKIMPETRLVAVLKARQDGFSWLVAAYTAWLLRFHKHSFVPMISQGQLEAADLLGKVRIVLDNLPEAWRVSYDPDSTLELGIKEMQSRARALASTEKAGRSLTATCVIIDEAEFQDYLPLTFAAIKPTIDAGGQIIMGSTVNKSKLKSVFKQYYRGAPQNGWTKRFWSVFDRPGRDEQWHADKRREAAEDESLGMNPDLFMEQEYPRTAEEALAPSRVISAFDMDVLAKMEEYVKEPVEQVGAIRVYNRFSVGRQYVAASDVSLGVGGDDSVTVVMDVRNGYIVADIQANDLPPDEFTALSVKMLDDYGNPEWAIEDNGPGNTVLTVAKQLMYPRIWARKAGPHSRSRVPGWHTGPVTRDPMWNELQSAVRNGLITVPSKAGLAQFYSVIVKTLRNGNTRIDHQYGAHDDYPTAVAIAWQIRDSAPSSANKLVVVGNRWG